MTGKLTFFAATMQYSILRFLPHRKQQFAACLEELSKNSPAEPYCQDILEIWLEEYGLNGLLLGGTALFLVGFLLMAAADALIHRAGNSGTASLVRILSGLYCIDKFQAGSRRTVQNMLLLFYIGICLLSGFLWTITFLFLVCFTGISAYAGKEGS